MTRLPIDVQLEVLIVHQKASSLFVDGEMSVIALCQQVHVVTMCQLCLHLNRLTVEVRPTNGVYVCPMAILTTLPQTCLHFWSGRLQVMVDHIEILKCWELGIVGQCADCNLRHVMRSEIKI